MNRDEFLAMAAISIDGRFPKGVANERKQAMLVIADLLQFLVDKGIVADA